MDQILKNHAQGRIAVYASTPMSALPQTSQGWRDTVRKVEDYDKKTKRAVIGNANLNYSWLQGAADTYRLSPDINDYLFTEVGIVTTGVPNRNLHCFPYDEVTYFDPRFGQFVYKTFVGKPTYSDHKNTDFLKAKGVHFDATMRKVPGWNIWKIHVLLGYDRTKDPYLVKAIEKGERRGYSMGAWVSYFLSSATGQIENGSQTMKYPKGSVVNGRLVYSNCAGVEFFETSSLVTDTQADTTAESHQLWYF